jgi:hypothetical protein
MNIIFLFYYSIKKIVAKHELKKASNDVQENVSSLETMFVCWMIG